MERESNIRYNKIGFHLFELFLFVLPAIPDSLSVRLGILSIYFIGHYFKVQVAYLTYKKKCLALPIPLDPEEIKKI